MPRNVFDQYSQPENRLSHALAVALAEDTGLLRRFIRHATGRPAPSGALQVVEQGVAGGLSVVPGDEERSGLPDIWIHDGEAWSLLIESKVAAPLTAEQLSRHRRTAARRGYTDIQLVAVTARDESLLAETRHLTWRRLYAWLSAQASDSAWAARVRDYMEILEVRMTSDGYLTDGALTEFTGIPFSDDEPYSYLEAKRLLALIMRELRERPSLQTTLGMALNAPGRPAITGKDADFVWDILRHEKAVDEDFVRYPHLTVVIARQQLSVSLMIPNGIRPELRRALLGSDVEDLIENLRPVYSNLEGVVSRCHGAQPTIGMLQRHYPSQRSMPITDADVHFDMRTVFGEYPSHRAGVKLQPEWMQLVHTALKRKRSNLQLSIATHYRYAACPAVRSPDILDLIEMSGLACAPLLARLMDTQGE